MDILAHGLWAAIAGKIYGKKTKQKINFWWLAFWGVFPDLFAFTLPFGWIFWGLTLGGVQLSDFSHPPLGEPAIGNTLPIINLTSMLYNFSHSLFVFGIIFLLVWGIKYLIQRKKKQGTVKPFWVMGGWLLHILLDIPSHSYKFYPTPFLWPFSEWKFDGISWGQPWFMVVNYGLIIILLFVLRRRDKK